MATSIVEVPQGVDLNTILPAFSAEAMNPANIPFTPPELMAVQADKLNEAYIAAGRPEISVSIQRYQPAQGTGTEDYKTYMLLKASPLKPAPTLSNRLKAIDPSLSRATYYVDVLLFVSQTVREPAKGTVYTYYSPNANANTSVSLPFSSVEEFETIMRSILGGVEVTEYIEGLTGQIRLTRNVPSVDTLTV